MAPPPFMVKSPEASASWERLRRLTKYERVLLNGKDRVEFEREYHLLPSKGLRPNIFQIFVHHNSMQIEAETEDYNIAVCRVVCPILQAMLPRELRDMVYRYLLPSEVILLTCLFTTCTMAVLCSAKDVPLERRMAYDYAVKKPRTRDDSNCPEHYWRDEVAGAGMTWELMEGWYRNVTFEDSTSITRGRDIICLLCDRFEAGLQPLQLISNFTYRWTFKTLAYQDYTYLPILSAMRGLQLLNNKARVRLEVHIEDGIAISTMSSGLRKFLTFVRPMILRLRRAEYRLKIQLEVPSWYRKFEEPFYAIVTEYMQEVDDEIKRGQVEVA